MSTFKVIFTAILLLLAAVGAFMLFGLVVAAVKFLFFVGVLAAIAVGAYKLTRGRERRELGAQDAHDELAEARRVIEEIKRKQLAGK